MWETRSIILTTGLCMYVYHIIHFVVSKINVNKTQNKKYFVHDIPFYCKISRHYVWNTPSSDNGLYAKCCKHWSFWGNFRPLFDSYWTVSQPIITSEQRAHQIVTFSGCIFPVFNYLRILRSPNTTNLFLNISIECEMCFIAEKYFIRKICVHRPSPFL